VEDQPGTRHFVVVDGQEGKPYQGPTGGPDFSPDSQRVGYAARDGHEKAFIVVDGKEGEPYDYILCDAQRQEGKVAMFGEHEAPTTCSMPDEDGVPLMFSPDSRHFAYVGLLGAKELRAFVVEDGRRGNAYRDVDERSLTFSPDGRHLAYAAETGETVGQLANETSAGCKVKPCPKPKWSVVVDGNEGKQYDGVGGFVYSSDSRRFAYTARLGSKWIVVLDGKEEQSYDTALAPAFSPDGQHFAYFGWAGGKGFVVIDGKPGRASYSSFPEGRIFFDSPTELHYLAANWNPTGGDEGVDVYVVEEVFH
jgi:hypothetical protein